MRSIAPDILNFSKNTSTGLKEKKRRRGSRRRETRASRGSQLFQGQGQDLGLAHCSSMMRGVCKPSRLLLCSF